MKSIKSKNQSKEQKVIHPIPPYNGYGSEEDSLLNVFYLDISNKNKERYIDRFKKDKHILRFLAKMISSNSSDEERVFLVSFFCGDETIQIFEIAGKNSGRESGKFLERQRIKNPYTHKYYSESNSDIFIDSNIKNVISRIKIGAISFGDYQDFLIHLLYVIDPKANNYATKEDISNGLKSFKIYLSEQELDTLLSKLKVQGDMYSMEDLYNCLSSN